MGSSLELPEERSMAKGSDHGKARVHKADGFKSSTHKVGCSLDSRQDLGIP